MNSKLYLKAAEVTSQAAFAGRYSL